MTDKVFVKREFVYTGERRASNGARMVSLAFIDAEGKLGEPQFFDWKKAYDKYVGNVYECEVSEDGQTVRGLDKAQWRRTWSDEGMRILWVAKDREAKSLHAQAALEKKAGAVDDIERVLRPLRKQYSACIARFDYGGADAIERAVIATLRQPLRKSEGG